MCQDHQVCEGSEGATRQGEKQQGSLYRVFYLLELYNPKNSGDPEGKAHHTLVEDIDVTPSISQHERQSPEPTLCKND
jgi:hypothetical protein